MTGAMARSRFLFEGGTRPVESPHSLSSFSAHRHQASRMQRFEHHYKVYQAPVSFAFKVLVDYHPTM